MAPRQRLQYLLVHSIPPVTKTVTAIQPRPPEAEEAASRGQNTGAAWKPAAGFSHFKEHMQIKLARVPIHLLSSWATISGNPQAKLTQFEIQIRFIFRGLYFPLVLVSMDIYFSLISIPGRDPRPTALQPGP